MQEYRYMYIKVVVTPNARKELLEEVTENRFKVSLKEKAERNMANNRVINIFASYFKVSRNKVRIISGHTNPSKMLSIDIED